MTVRLYYTDAYCRTFDARVTRAFTHDGRPAVTLDRTAFYPTAGGQPHDVGRLGGVEVIEVVDSPLHGAGEAGTDDVIHLLSAPLAEGASVTGDIDWARRFDHMQQHTGQHLLSAAFDRLFENATVGFHMGADVSTIDLARAATPSEVERAVDAANAIVWEDRPVAIRFVSQEEAATQALRKDPARQGPLRLVDIEGFDVCACGGTHIGRAGAVGLIAALGSERQRGGTRLTFACGGRAVVALRTYRNAVAGSVRVLSVLPSELPAAVERMQAECKDLQKEIRGVQGRLAAYEGARLVAGAAAVGGVRIVIEALAEWDAAGLKAVASAAIGAGRACVVLVSPAAPLSVVVARSPDVPLDASVLLRQLTERCGGRGGGKPDLAQGGGLTAPVHEIASAARAIIESALRG